MSAVPVWGALVITNVWVVGASKPWHYGMAAAWLVFALVMVYRESKR